MSLSRVSNLLLVTFVVLNYPFQGKRRGLYAPVFLRVLYERFCLVCDLFCVGCNMRNFGNYGVTFLVLLFTLFALPANAIAMRSYNGKLNEAVGGLIHTKLNKYGFAANDPRYDATFAGATAALTTVAGGAAVVAAGTVSWPALLASAAIQTVAVSALTLCGDSLINWYFNDDKTITGKGPGLGPAADIPSLATMPGSYADVLGYGFGGDIYFKYRASSSNPWVARQFRNISLPCPTSGGCYTSNFDKDRDVNFNEASIPATGPYWSNRYRVKVGDFVQIVYELVRTPLPIEPPAYEPQPKSPDDAIKDLPDSIADQPLSDEMLAAIANAVMKAASPYPNAIPFSPTNPITPPDVATWRAANPGKAPAVQDLAAPSAAPGAEKVPVPIPAPAGAPAGEPVPEPSPEPTPGTGASIDLGADPNVSAPMIDSPPDALTIMQPLLNLMPSLKNFSANMPTGQCPQPSFVVFNKEYSINAHCVLSQDYFGQLATMMLLLWAMASIFVVLRA